MAEAISDKRLDQIRRLREGLIYPVGLAIGPLFDELLIEVYRLREELASSGTSGSNEDLNRMLVELGLTSANDAELEDWTVCLTGRQRHQLRVGLVYWRNDSVAALIRDRTEAIAEADRLRKQLAAGQGRAKNAEADALRAGSEPPIEFVCSICLYDYVDWSTLSEEQLAERNFLTVINGQMACEYHASIVGGGDHGLALMRAKQQGMRS